MASKEKSNTALSSSEGLKDRTSVRCIEQQTGKAQGRAKTPVGDTVFADLRQLHSLDDLDSYDFVQKESEPNEDLRAQRHFFSHKEPVDPRPPKEPSKVAGKKSVSPCNSQSSETFTLTKDQLQEIQEAHEVMEDQIHKLKSQVRQFEEQEQLESGRVADL